MHNATIASVESIPLIDLAALDSETDSEIGLALLDAYSKVGFGYLVNHGIDPKLIEAVFTESRRFHGLPMQAKMALELDSRHRGYIPFKASTDVNSSLEKVTKPNQSESFMVMRDLGTEHPDVLAGAYLAGSNQWPTSLPGFREVLEEYQLAMTRLATSLMRVLADALGDDGSMVGAFDSPTTWLRLLHYPPQAPEAPGDEYGSAPHRDFGAITILAQDDVGGLSVQTVDGGWVAAPPIPGTFVMNVGDMLHRWSNGRLLSTPHRVTNRSGRERYSVPFFFDPHVGTVIEPLPSCLKKGETSAFPPLVFGDFLRSELESAYVHHGATGA